MKKYISFLIFLVFVSCSKDSESSEPTIYRKWYFIESVIDGVTIPYEGNESCGKDYIEFYQQNHVRMVDIDDCDKDIAWERTFTFEDFVLTVNDAGFDYSVVVTELSFDYLVYEYDADSNDDGVLEHHVDRFSTY